MVVLFTPAKKDEVEHIFVTIAFVSIVQQKDKSVVMAKHAPCSNEVLKDPLVNHVAGIPNLKQVISPKGFLEAVICNLLQNRAERLILVKVTYGNYFEKLVNWYFLSHSMEKVLRGCILVHVLLSLL